MDIETNDMICQLLGINPKIIYWGGSGDGLRVYPELTADENKDNLDKLKEAINNIKWNY